MANVKKGKKAKPTRDEALAWAKAGEDPPPCTYCGKLVLAGGYCCTGAAYDQGYRDGGPALLGLVLMAEAIRRNQLPGGAAFAMFDIAKAAIETVESVTCRCHYCWTSRGRHDPHGCAWETLTPVREAVEAAKLLR